MSEEPFQPCGVIFPASYPQDWKIELRLVKGRKKRTYEVWLNQERLLGWVMAFKQYRRPGRTSGARLNTDWRWAPVGGEYNGPHQIKDARADAVILLVDDVLCKPAKIGRWAPKPWEPEMPSD